MDVLFLRTLELSMPGTFLLPNLRILSWMVEDDGFFPLCRLFFPPTLISLSVVLQDCIPDLSLFSTLQISHPHLTDIHVDVPASAASVRVVSSAVCAWKLIQKLTVVTLDEVALIHIAGLPQLQDLQLHSYIPPCSSERLSILIPPRAFPTLRHLDILADTIQSAFSLITHISSVELEELHINTSQCAPAYVWEEAFSTLQRLPSRQHLNSLSLCQRDNIPSIPANMVNKYVLTREAVLPLLTFPALVNLSLQPFFGLDLDDATVHEMAASWPTLEVLELGAERAVPSPPRTTLRSLVYLAEHCPHLHSLQLPVNATDPVPRFSRPRKAMPPYRLAYLHTGPSPVTTPALVAAFLSNSFASIGFGHRPDTDANRPWNEVSRLFKIFRSVRAAEMRCWTSEEESDSDGWDEISDEDSDDE